jgi:hypothetical protein
MKYAFVALLGLLLGAAVGAAAIYYNPFTRTSAPPSVGAERTLHYGLPGEVLGFRIGSAVVPPGMPKLDDVFWENTIDRTALLSVLLEDSQNKPTAVASRLLAVSPRSDFLLAGVRVNDYWLLTIPGEGTLFLRAEANVWPFLRETLPVWYLGRPWKGPSDYRPTTGPGHDGTAVVIGATGRLAGLEGSAVESYRITDLDANSRSAAATGEIDLHLASRRVASE